MSKLLAAGLAMLAVSASAQTVVYDTFNEDDPQTLFDCCNTIAVDGNHADRSKASVAIPFTPTAFAKITEVDVALSSLSYPDQLKISIAGSSLGLPGREKKTWVRTPLPGGQCCTFVALRPGQAVHAEAGGQYWIILDGKKHADGGWNLNTLGLSGPYAVKGDDGVWTKTEGPLPAVRIIAK